MVDETRVGDIRVVIGLTEINPSFDAVVVVLFAGKRVVLVKNEGRAWEFPGGHRDGNESCEETAVREVLEEAGAHIAGIQHLGYYVAPTGQVTLITCADVSSPESCAREDDASPVGLFDELPAVLSFGDGREQLFLDCALRVRAGQRADGGRPASQRWPCLTAPLKRRGVLDGMAGLGERRSGHERTRLHSGGCFHGQALRR